MSYWGRVAFVAGIGVAIGVAGSLPEWNWYGFSTVFTAFEMGDVIVGWFLGGLVLAKVGR